MLWNPDKRGAIRPEVWLAHYKAKERVEREYQERKRIEAMTDDEKLREELEFDRRWAEGE